MNIKECPYIGEANNICNVLVNEVAQADTWTRIQDAIWAIQRVRSKAKHHIAEWEHFNNPSPSGKMNDTSKPNQTKPN